MANKYLDENGLLYFWQKIVNKFVAKDGSKVLSDNNYTTAEKNKLAGIATGAEVNVIETVKRNGTALTITDKAVDVTVPTKTSDLTNDSDYVADASYVHTDNNFTSDLKTKLDGIATGATVDDKTWNSVSLTKSSSTSETYIPALSGTSASTAKLHPASATPSAKYIAMFDGSKYLSSTTPAAGNNSTLVATTAFVATAISNALANVTSISYEVVTSLPTTGSAGVIYLVAHSHGTNDVYDEYIWTGSAYEKIGNTDVDLSGYMLTTDMVAITNSEIDTIVAS